MYKVIIMTGSGAETQKWNSEATALAIAKHRLIEGARYVEIRGPQYNMRLEPPI